MSHLDPERLALAALETSSIRPAELGHLESCPECHAEFLALKRTAATARAAVDVGELLEPPPAVWDRIVEQLHLDVPATAVPPLPSRRSLRSAPGVLPARRRILAGGWLVAAAVTVVSVVGAAIWITMTFGSDRAIARADLAAFPAHQGASGVATVVRDSSGEALQVTVDDVSTPPGTHQEVWLMSQDGSSLVSLGSLDGTTAVLAVPAGIDLLSYPLVDVSEEPDDGDPSHSGDSIIRGRLQLL